MKETIILPHPWKKYNIRWVLQIGSQYILQVHGSYADILVFENNQLKKKFVNDQNSVKPHHFEFDGEHYLIFGFEKGTVKMIHYFPKTFEFEVIDEFKPLEFSANQRNQSNQSLNESLTESDTILCLKFLPDREAIAVGFMNKGLHIIDIELGKQKFLKPSYVYLGKKSIKDVLDMGHEQIILVVTYQNPDYYVINLQYNLVTLLGEGFSDLAYSITPFPSFDYERFPYVICKESECICILDPTPSNKMARIFLTPTKSSADKLFNEDTVVFDVNNPRIFYTSKNSLYLAKYEINPALYEALRISKA